MGILMIYKYQLIEFLINYSYWSYVGTILPGRIETFHEYFKPLITIWLQIALYKLNTKVNNIIFEFKNLKTLILRISTVHMILSFYRRLSVCELLILWNGYWLVMCHISDLKVPLTKYTIRYNSYSNLVRIRPRDTFLNDFISVQAFRNFLNPLSLNHSAHKTIHKVEECYDFTQIMDRPYLSAPNTVSVKVWVLKNHPFREKVKQDYQNSF